jgi:hypothetical protein
MDVQLQDADTPVCASDLYCLLYRLLCCLLYCLCASDLYCLPLIMLDCRSAEETKLSMHLKDSMREQCIAEVAAAWFNITQLYKASRPELAAFVLSSAARYVHWMDIGLVANDR